MSIPTGLFDHNTLVTNFNYTFQDCYHIDTAIPEWWNTTLYPTATYPQFGTQSTKTQMFTNCDSAANYASVPSAWK